MELSALELFQVSSLESVTTLINEQHGGEDLIDSYKLALETLFKDKEEGKRILSIAAEICEYSQHVAEILNDEVGEMLEYQIKCVERLMYFYENTMEENWITAYASALRILFDTREEMEVVLEVISKRFHLDMPVQKILDSVKELEY